MTVMPTSDNSATAFNHLAAGRAAEALEVFSAMPRQPGNDVIRLIGIALASRELGRAELLSEATTALLAAEPGNLWGNLLHGEYLASRGDSISALSFLMNALRIADQQTSLPAQLVKEVDAARQYCASFSARLESDIRQALPSAYTQSGSLDEFRQSIDILFGRKQIYPQSPRYYYYPGLPQKQFFAADQFDWIPALEEQTANIREEALRMLRDSDSFQPYLQSDPGRPRKSQDGMTDNPAWSACYLIRNGTVVDEVAAQCPATLAAVRKLPLCELPRRSPSVLFSLLRPGAHIPPHCGLVNTRLIGHLPVVTPPGCQLRVGNETREWQQGKVWLFDDSIEHEAWNRSNETRVILLFEIWRPELSAGEKLAIQALFASLDGSTPGMPDWEI